MCERTLRGELTWQFSRFLAGEVQRVSRQTRGREKAEIRGGSTRRTLGDRE